MSAPKHITNEEIDAQITSTLAAVYRASGYEPVERCTPLSELLVKEEGYCLDEQGREMSVAEVRAETFRWWMMWLFERGMDPRVVVQRIFALAKELTPAVIADMPEEAIALLLHDGGRATVNARGKAVVLGLKHALGVRTDLGTHHKAERARTRMAAAAKGNRNRATGRRPRLRALPSPTQPSSTSQAA